MFLHIAAVSLIVVIANAAKLSSFSKQSLNLNECISNKIEAAKPYLAEGLPELFIPSLKHIIIPYAVVNKPNFQFALWNSNISGLENFNVLKVDIDPTNNLFKFQIAFPYAQNEGSYGCKGNLFNMKFDSTGPVRANATNLILDLELKANLVKRNGQNHLELVNRNIDVTLDGILQMYLYNLYSGNAEITEIMNTILNNNSYYMFEMLVPILENHLDKLLEKAVDNFFQTYTYEELLPQ